MKSQGDPMEDVELVVADEAAERTMAFLEARIDAFNVAATGFRDGRWLVVLLRDDDGRIVAGLGGHTWGGTAEVRFLWVDAPRRREGLGRRLLRAAEEEARGRGCGKIVLSSHSFQAPDFYRALGYTEVGRIADYPRGHGQIFLEKDL